jgi:2',3'-cyclic-nucleotide 2'-phosphodiesterase (5'-nucleotidase family)
LFSQDLRLESLHERLDELSKSTQIINSNLRQHLPKDAEWMQSVTKPYSIISSPCNKVRVALLGLLSDEPGVFRDNTFKSIPIANVIDTYASMYKEIIVPKLADACIPLTHQSMHRDKELAESMLSLHGGKGIIIGGHDHEPMDELVGQDDDSSIRILKSGMDATTASLIDLSFEITDEEPHIITSIEAKLEPISDLEPSDVIQKIVDKHESIIRALEDEDIIDSDSSNLLPAGSLLSSVRTRYKQTTVGSIFLQMIKEELEIDAAIMNGAPIKGGKTYPSGKMSYAELKKELPFPTKMVVVPMYRWELQDAIDYSRTATDQDIDAPNSDDIPRRGYLQVDSDYDNLGHIGFPDDVLDVGLPRNLLDGFCNIKPLMALGDRLKEKNRYPGSDEVSALFTFCFFAVLLY